MATQLAELDVDLVTRSHLEKGLESLEEEFAGIFGSETIERYMAESLRRARPAKVAELRPAVRPSVRPRAAARAWPRSRSKITKDVPEVLFVCVAQRRAQPDGRGAAGQARRGPGPRPLRGLRPGRARSTRPRSRRWPRSASTSRRSSRSRSPTSSSRAADAVITMGCGDACPIYPGKRYEDWELDDPAGKDLETVRRIRDEIERAGADASRRARAARWTRPDLARRALAEGFAAFALVFAGCGAIVAERAATAARSAPSASRSSSG